MSEEGQLGPSWDGTVMLDIGGDIGALILHTGAEMHLAEIELSRVDGADANLHPHVHGDGHAHTHAGGRTHVAVRERRGPTGIRYAAIYPGLREGEYVVHDTAGQPKQNVTIVGGQVAEIDWT